MDQMPSHQYHSSEKIFIPEDFERKQFLKKQMQESVQWKRVVGVPKVFQFVMSQYSDMQSDQVVQVRDRLDQLFLLEGFTYFPESTEIVLRTSILKKESELLDILIEDAVRDCAFAADAYLAGIVNEIPLFVSECTVNFLERNETFKRDQQKIDGWVGEIIDIKVEEYEEQDGVALSIHLPPPRVGYKEGLLLIREDIKNLKTYILDHSELDVRVITLSSWLIQRDKVDMFLDLLEVDNATVSHTEYEGGEFSDDMFHIYSPAVSYNTSVAENWLKYAELPSIGKIVISREAFLESTVQ
jgi:hypothetical protein